MKGAVGLAALGCYALGLTSAKVLKWSPDHDDANSRNRAPAQATLGYMPSMGVFTPAPMPTPAPTSPPQRQHHLDARDATDNTCAYISGSSEYPLYCPVTARCVYNTFNSHVGCCQDSSTICPVFTKCLDRTQSARFTTDNGFTAWCGQASYPHCLTHTFAGPRTGYTLLGCGVAAGTDEVLQTVFSISAPSTTSLPTTSSKSSTDTADTAGVTDNSSPNNQPASSSPSSSPPIAAIVGGVVGGVAVIAVLAFCIFLLVRHNKKKTAAATAPLPPKDFNGPSGQHMSQQPPAVGHYPASTADTGHTGFSPVGTGAAAHGSMYDQGVSPPASPPPASHNSPSPSGYPLPQTTPPPNGFAGAAAAYSHPPPPTQYQNTPPSAYSSTGYPSPGSAAHPGPYPPQQPGAYPPQQGGYPPQQPGVYPIQGGGYPAQPQPQYQAYAPPPQQQLHHPPQPPPQPQTYSELPTERGDGEVRELHG
ncbi:hypothetical protein B0T24DRAFT_594033 [Lasiosphaeria ovina]|uniref:Uncharacterized protein n=1 Tax=Lasiosphaeria ovina TaxID=92902 RepID=A0AAE0KBR6_9PEZI|nr:hypothetical protein B0T24DRAFT_594033 [Lasiosphaeria ovina]